MESIQNWGQLNKYAMIKANKLFLYIISLRANPLAQTSKTGFGQLKILKNIFLHLLPFKAKTVII